MTSSARPTTHASPRATFVSMSAVYENACHTSPPSTAPSSRNECGLLPRPASVVVVARPRPRPTHYMKLIVSSCR